MPTEAFSLRHERHLALGFAVLGVLFAALITGYWLLVLEPGLRTDAESRTRALAQAQARSLEVLFGLELPRARLVAELDARIDSLLLLRETRGGLPLIRRIEVEFDPELALLPPGQQRMVRGTPDAACRYCLEVMIPLYHPRHQQLIGLMRFTADNVSLNQLITAMRSKLILTGGAILVLILIVWRWVNRLLRRLRDSEKNVRNLIDLAPFPLVLLTQDQQRICLANQAAQQDLDLERDASGDLDSPLWHEIRAHGLALFSKKRMELCLGEAEQNHGRWMMLSTTEVNFAGVPHQLMSLVDVSEFKTIQQQLHRAANTDGLTNIYNRRYLFERLEQELARASREPLALSVILFDLDKFKAINDNFGHNAGDEVLVQTAQVLRQCIRAMDICGRYGGEEFLVILPSADLDTARRIGERIRLGIEQLPPVRPGLQLSISGGIAGYQGESLDSLLERADRYLYQAKQQGRNRLMG
jgi:diguanylate cyclase (GGDEF)-like protein